MRQLEYEKRTDIGCGNRWADARILASTAWLPDSKQLRLAGELKRSSGDHRIAFTAYEKRLRAFIEKKQKGAENFGKWFAPDTQFAVFLRNQITKLFAIPFFADKFVRDTIADELRLPDYS